jgi:hypothetical protein
MRDSSLPQGERGYELLLEHCVALTKDASRRAPAFERLEEVLGGELARLLLVALAKQRAARLVI